MESSLYNSRKVLVNGKKNTKELNNFIEDAKKNQDKIEKENISININENANDFAVYLYGYNGKLAREWKHEVRIDDIFQEIENIKNYYSQKAGYLNENIDLNKLYQQKANKYRLKYYNMKNINE
jgi:urocanate hydratase